MDEKLERIDEALDKLVPMIVQRERYENPDQHKEALRELLSLIATEVWRLLRLLGD